MSHRADNFEKKFKQRSRAYLWDHNASSIWIGLNVLPIPKRSPNKSRKARIG